MNAYYAAMTQFRATAPFALGNVGACLFMVGRYDEAIDHYAPRRPARIRSR